MRYGLIATFFLSATLISPAFAAARAPDAGPDLGANAALSYWQAFAFLPALDKPRETILGAWGKAPFDPAAMELIASYQRSRAAFHRGAKAARCDWGLDYSEGIRLLLPHLPKAVTLARLAALNARHEFSQGHWAAGSEDVAALLGMARHLGTDRLIIPHLQGARLEAMAIEVAAPYLRELKRALPEAAPAVLDAPPAGVTLAEMILTEKQIGPAWMIGELKAAEARKPGSWKVVWDEILLAPGEGGANPAREVAGTVKTFPQAVKALEGILPWYDRLAEAAGLPRDEFDRRQAELVAQAKAASPAGSLFLPAVDRIVEAQRRDQARRSLFQAAIAVVRGGPESLKGVKDPFGDGPFEYRAVGKGFELRSKLLFRGQPVTLTVGQGTSS